MEHQPEGPRMPNNIRKTYRRPPSDRKTSGRLPKILLAKMMCRKYPEPKIFWNIAQKALECLKTSGKHTEDLQVTEKHQEGTQINFSQI